MPVIILSSPSRLQLRLVVGVDTEGEDIYRLRSFGNIKHDAGDADLLAIAAALGALQVHPVEAIRRIDQADLVSST